MRRPDYTRPEEMNSTVIVVWRYDSLCRSPFPAPRRSTGIEA